MILNINLIYINPGYYTAVIDTPAQSLDIKPIEYLSTNKNELIWFIKEELEKILSEYDIPKLSHSMKRRLQAVIDAQGEHTKY